MPNLQMAHAEAFRDGSRPAPVSGPAAVARHDIEFVSDGTICRAWLYVPREQRKAQIPIIVMAHGLGGTRDSSLEPYAERFAAAGLQVLLFDYRYMGASDGEPRQLVSIDAQLEDWRAAVACARTLPGVDAERVGLWGSSLSGGHVIVTAARDARIAAVSAQCPMLDGLASARMALAAVGPAIMVHLTGSALLDVGAMLAGQKPHYIPLVAPPGVPAAMSTPGAYKGCMRIVPPGWRNQVAARFLLTLPLYRPILYAADVRCAALLVVCSRDTITSAKAAVRTAARLGEQARVVALPIDHFDVYRGPWFERAVAEQLAFFQAALAPD